MLNITKDSVNLVILPEKEDYDFLMGRIDSVIDTLDNLAIRVQALEDEVFGMEPPAEEPPPEEEPPPPEEEPTPDPVLETTLHKNYSNDVDTYSRGWASAYLINSGEILFWGGHSHNPQGNNAVRIFNPETNVWTRLSSNTGSKWDSVTKTYTDGSNAVTNRDNHLDFYVPSRNEYWVFGGAINGGNFGGVFDLNTNTWTKVVMTGSEFGAGLIKDFSYNGVYNPAMAWNKDLDTGCWFGGNNVAGPTNTLNLIEPNPEGPEPYKQYSMSLAVPAVKYLRNNGVCVGEYFYVYGGRKADDTYVSTLFRFHIPSQSLEILANGPVSNYYPVLTYDSIRNQLVLQGGSNSNRLHTYDIETNVWTDLTDSTMDSYQHNHSGAYHPVVDEHIYRGGIRFDSTGADKGWNYSSQIYAIQLATSEVAEPPAEEEDPPTQDIVVRSVPASGEGPSGGMKHMRYAVNPTNKRIYLGGGDYHGPNFQDSGRQEVYSYDIYTDTWFLEHQYCPNGDSIPPFHTDEAGWVWDSLRGNFWILPGTQYGTGCDGLKGKVMGFDPVSQTWFVPTQTGKQTNTSYWPKFANYDELTDQVIQINRDDVYHWEVSTGNWTTVVGGMWDKATNESYVAQIGRVLYVLDTKRRQLVGYDIDQRKNVHWEFLPAEYTSPIVRPFQIHAIGDKLYMFNPSPYDDGTWYDVPMLTYVPSTRIWESHPMIIPGIEHFRANVSVYHPDTGYIMFMGGVAPNNSKIVLYKPTV